MFVLCCAVSRTNYSPRFGLQDVGSASESSDVVELDIRGPGDFGIDFGVRHGRGGVKPLEISSIRPG